MSLYGSFALANNLSELGDPLDRQGQAVLSAADRRATALRNLLGDSNITVAQVTALSGVTPGTAKASAALVLNSSKELSWAISDSGTSTVTPLNFALTATGIGASVDGALFSTTTEAALGTYANALNGKLNFGTAGKATGLGGAICAELDLGPVPRMGPMPVSRPNSTSRPRARSARAPRSCL